MEGGGWAGQHRVMQNETPKTSTAATFGRSSIARLPPELREAVDTAIADGATIDEIADLIRGEGGACSRSAVGRYTKNVRDLILRQQETDRANEMWVRALGERAEGRAELILIETLRTMTLGTMAEFAKSGEPVPTQELARLSLILKRIEGTDKLRLQRERVAAKEAKAAAGAGQAPGQAPPRKGLSPETVDLIDEAVVGFRFRPRPPVTSAPVDPWNPSESHLIPLNPGESRPENVSGVSSFISLNGGREVNHFPQAPGAHVVLPRAFRATFAWLRAYARGAVAPSGPLRSPVRRPFEIAPRRPAVPPATSWPDLPGLVPGIRPSIGPRTREEAWRREMPGTSPGMTRWVGRSGVGHEEGRTAGPEHATACRAAWRVGKRAELAPAVEGNERGEMRAGYRPYGPPGASRRGPSLTQRTMADAGACSAYVSSIIHRWIERIVSYLSSKRASRPLMAGSGVCSGLIPVHETSVVGA